MKCFICGEKQFKCVHKGTRDVPTINVMKCCNCGFIQLDNREYNMEENYMGGGMLRDAYAAISDKTEYMEWEVWRQETVWDDNRRYDMLKEICTGKDVLEFGCGNGGFLKRIKGVAKNVAGIELMDEARENIAREGIEVYKTLDSIDKKYDIVCTFMVIEHLNNPEEIIRKVSNILIDGGTLICETPNLQDALISKYRCAAFEDFTYWSKHVVLFSSATLERLMVRNGFVTSSNTQIQRYSLANHLYWLSEGKPGGHMKWTEFNEKELNDRYAEKLIEEGIADTL